MFLPTGCGMTSRARRSLYPQLLRVSQLNIYLASALENCCATCCERVWGHTCLMYVPSPMHTNLWYRARACWRRRDEKWCALVGCWPRAVECQSHSLAANNSACPGHWPWQQQCLLLSLGFEFWTVVSRLSVPAQLACCDWNLPVGWFAGFAVYHTPVGHCPCRTSGRSLVRWWGHAKCLGRWWGFTAPLAGSSVKRHVIDGLAALPSHRIGRAPPAPSRPPDWFWLIDWFSLCHRDTQGVVYFGAAVASSPHHQVVGGAVKAT